MKIFLGAVAGIIIALGAFFTGHSQAPSFAAFSPSGGGTYRLGQSVGTSDTSIKLSAFKEPVSNIPYTMTYLNTTTGYGTISPQSTVSEFISFSGITQNSDGSATLTGVTRGLTRTPAGSNCVASTTLAQSHAGQSIFILSNSPCFYAEYAVKQNNENISGVWNFMTLPTTSVACSAQNQFCNKGYIDQGLLQGAATSTEANMGIVRISDVSNTGFGNASSSSGAPIAIENKFATSTPGVQCTNNFRCIVAAAAGKIAQSWLDLTASFTFAGGLVSSGATNIAASVASPLTLNGLAYSFNGTRAASSTVPQEDGSGHIAWLPQGQTLLAATTTTVAMTYATTTFPAFAHLKIEVFTPGSPSYGLCANFNNDFGANYGSSFYGIGGSGLNSTQWSNSNSLILGINNSTTTDQFISMEVNNTSAAKRKQITFTVTSSDSLARAPASFGGGAVWSNTSAQITSFVLNGSLTGCNNGAFPAGTTISVFGSN